MPNSSSNSRRKPVPRFRRPLLSPGKFPFQSHRLIRPPLTNNTVCSRRISAATTSRTTFASFLAASISLHAHNFRRCYRKTVWLQRSYALHGPKNLRMNHASQRPKSLQKIGRGSIQKLVRNTINTAFPHCARATATAFSRSPGLTEPGRRRRTRQTPARLDPGRRRLGIGHRSRAFPETARPQHKPTPRPTFANQSAACPIPHSRPPRLSTCDRIPHRHKDDPSSPRPPPRLDPVHAKCRPEAGCPDRRRPVSGRERQHRDAAFEDGSQTIPTGRERTQAPGRAKPRGFPRCSMTTKHHHF